MPLAPHDDAWNGLSVNGPMARTVEDAALFLDVTTSDGGFVEAAAREPGRLRIALSTKVPPPLQARVGVAQRAAVEEAGALLRELGHEVIVRDPDYPPKAVAHALSRYFRGVHDDVQHAGPSRAARAAHPQLRQDRRDDLRAADEQAIRAAESEVAERVQSIYDDVDVVITPGTATGPSRIGAYQKRGALSTLTLVAVSRAVPGDRST